MTLLLGLSVLTPCKSIISALHGTACKPPARAVSQLPSVVGSCEAGALICLSSQKCIFFSAPYD